VIARFAAWNIADGLVYKVAALTEPLLAVFWILDAANYFSADPGVPKTQDSYWIFTGWISSTLRIPFGISV
jgi:hypothetical protein